MLVIGHIETVLCYRAQEQGWADSSQNMDFRSWFQVRGEYCVTCLHPSLKPQPVQRHAVLTVVYILRSSLEETQVECFYVQGLIHDSAVALKLKTGVFTFCCPKLTCRSSLRPHMLHVLVYQKNVIECVDDGWFKQPHLVESGWALVLGEAANLLHIK